MVRDLASVYTGQGRPGADRHVASSNLTGKFEALGSLAVATALIGGALGIGTYSRKKYSSRSAGADLACFQAYIPTSSSFMPFHMRQSQLHLSSHMQLTPCSTARRVFSVMLEATLTCMH